MKRILALLASLALAACGGAEEIALRIDKPASGLMMPLTLASAAEVSEFLPGIKVVKTRPSDREILFTMPGDGKAAPATIRFSFEPLDGGKATQVRAFVDVPAVAATIDGQQKVLSESKVSTAVLEVLQDMARGDTSQATGELSKVLVAVAIATDAGIRDKALAMARAPMDLSDMLEGEDADLPEPAEPSSGEDNDPTEFDAPPSDGGDYDSDMASESFAEEA